MTGEGDREARGGVNNPDRGGGELRRTRLRGATSVVRSMTGVSLTGAGPGEGREESDSEVRSMVPEEDPSAPEEVAARAARRAGSSVLRRAA